VLKTVIASMMAVAATMLLSIGAAADASVQHVNLNSPEQCNTFSYNVNYYTICYSSTGEATMVQAPAGNWSGEVNGTFSNTFSQNATLLFSGATAVHEHFLYSASTGVLKEDGVHETGTFSYSGITCTYGVDLHVTDVNFATGSAHVQYSNFTYSCV
jgi:hypothetical protein